MKTDFWGTVRLTRRVLTALENGKDCDICKMGDCHSCAIDQAWYLIPRLACRCLRQAAEIKRLRATLAAKTKKN